MEPGYESARPPFSALWPLAAGATSGLALRLVFSGSPGDAFAAMTAGFILLVPVLVGAVTVYVAETQRRRRWWYYVVAPAASNALFVAGTLVILIEGLICAFIILPLFTLLGAVGGLAMGGVCRLTNWPKQTLSCFALLPLALGGIDFGPPLPERIAALDRTVLISASPEVVWRQLLDAQDIRPEEVQHAWLYRIGVPLPLEGRMRRTDDELVRRVKMGRDIYFDEVISNRRENRFIQWSYRFYEDSFPRHALDEHVVIGGHYFDVLDTSYTLTPRGDATEVSMRIHYRVSTRFNWYARPAAQFLLGNLAESNLDYYRGRAEAQAASQAAGSGGG